MSIIIFAILLLYFLYDYRKGSILILLLTPFLSMVLIGGKSLSLFLGLIVLFKWMIASQRKWKVFSTSVFLCPVLVLGFSYLISNHYGRSPHLPSAITNTMQLFFVFVLIDYLGRFTYLKKYALKVVIVMAAVLSVNGLIETLTHYNIILNLAIATGLYPSDTPIITEIRYGLKRAQSAFGMHTSWGGYAFIVCCFLLYLKKYCNITFKYANYLIILLGMNIFFTGARSAFLGFAIALLAFVDVKDLKSKKIWGLILFVIAISPLFIGYFGDIVSSFTDTEKVNGSNADMRQTQFDICFYYLTQSPWIGNGIAFTWEYVLPQNKDLLGAESLWIPVLIDQGILGAVAVSSMFVACMIYLIKHNAIRYTIVVLGFLVFNSMSSIPNISITDFVYYVILLCMFIPNKKYKYETTTKRITK